MKHGKLFAKIIYYLFTFTMGIMLAVFLPFILMSDGECLNIMEDSLEEGRYSDAMLLVGGYFDKREVFKSEFENGGGIVLFSSATLVYFDDEETEDETKIHKSYAGFVYGTKDSYPVTSQVANKTKMLVEDGTGTEHTVELLDSDLNNDKINDTVATYYTNGFFFVDLDEDTFSSLRKLKLLDKDGNVFQEISLQLDYEEEFFADVNDFVNEYNRDYKSEKLTELHEKLLGKSEHYTISSMGVAQSRADTKAAIIVVVYFVSVYVIADFLLGRRFILRFFKWFLYKVCKVKPKQKKAPKRNEVFGNDYYCQVSFELDVSEVEGFSESVNIRYTSEKGEAINFILLKQENYKSTQRIKAGEYVNMWIDIDKAEYATQDLPESLTVEGYQKAFKIKILRREEKRDENINSKSD